MAFKINKKSEQNKLQVTAFGQKRDWSRHHTNKYTTADVIETWQTSLWPISGKHKGKQLKNLPFKYLEWVIDNFQADSVGYKLAVQELECRYHNTINT